ncbi:efflux protein EncT [Kwoniella heveanensis BCC8398]|uniref:Efflux protein EncT n=1 Tax=Kwoniella heveanensis BCC8398 TaxID=1296120 RepID=A0A1B9GPS8_9TREE|nr:efflux protein EncT [Kwoniella heveanensis BCC8398]
MSGVALPEKVDGTVHQAGFLPTAHTVKYLDTADHNTVEEEVHHEHSKPSEPTSTAPSLPESQNHAQTTSKAGNTAAGNELERKLTQLREGATDSEHYNHPLAKLGQNRKNFLLFIFSIASFVDICNVSGVAVAVAQISFDIKLELSQIVWIITSYSLCFSAFLLFAGRLADLFPAQIIFEGGFMALGIFSLVVSFVTSNKFGFLILRGLGGISGALTIPSAFHLLVHMFPNPAEQQKKLAMLSLAGGLGNVLGLVLAGLCMEASYHWFFRLMAIICIVFSICAIFLLPYTGSTYSSANDPIPRWRRMDVPGVILMMGALICFILSLTQGPIDGWGSASFIAPFIISFPLGIGFFFWESRIPPKTAVLPSSIWKITNIIILSIAVLIGFPFWATSQIAYSTWWQEVYGWSPLHVAAAMLPQGLVCLVAAAFAQLFPQVITKPRITIPVAGVLIIVGEILQVFSDGGPGKHYWKFCFPAFLLGSFGAMIGFFASAINVITYCPPEMAGVAGAWTNVIAQIGGAVTLAVQAGMQGTGFVTWEKSVARTWYFMIAWTALIAIQFVVFYKEPMTPEEEHDAARKRIMETTGEIGV